jgi:hypothetical protein
VILKIPSDYGYAQVAVVALGYNLSLGLGKNLKAEPRDQSHVAKVSLQYCCVQGQVCIDCGSTA